MSLGLCARSRGIKRGALAAFKAVGSLASLLHACRRRELSLHSGHGVKTLTSRPTHSRQPNTHALQGDGVMASVSVVGQHPGPHRLDSEQQLLLFKLPGGKKISRKSSWEKMLFRRGSGSGGRCGSVTSEGEPGTHPLSPGPAGERTMRGELMPGERCGAPAAPRSPDQDREMGSTDCDRRTAAGTRESQTGHNINCDSNHNTGGRRRTSLKRSGGSVTNGHSGAHRDAPHGRRDARSIDNISSSSERAQEETGGLPLPRLTQGRTGVVRLARTEPLRMEAWSIFPREMDPRVKTERGEGHRFEAKPVTRDWCDACSCQITAQALKCQSK